MQNLEQSINTNTIINNCVQSILYSVIKSFRLVCINTFQSEPDVVKFKSILDDNTVLFINKLNAAFNEFILFYNKYFKNTDFYSEYINNKLDITSIQKEIDIIKSFDVFSNLQTDQLNKDDIIKIDYLLSKIEDIKNKMLSLIDEFHNMNKI